MTEQTKKAPKRQRREEAASPPIPEAPQKKLRKSKTQKKKIQTHPPLRQVKMVGGIMPARLSMRVVRVMGLPLGRTTHSSPLNPQSRGQTPDHPSFSRASRVSPGVIQPLEMRMVSSNLKIAKIWQIQEESSPPYLKGCWVLNRVET